jgi:hypothetical protein
MLIREADIMKTRKTHEEYVRELKEKNLNIEAIEQYVDAHTKILHKCKIDGHEWNIAPTKILEGKGCPVCAGKAIGPKPEYKNSIWASEYKEYFSEFLSEEQMKMYTPHSGKNIYIACKHCGLLKQIQPKTILNCPLKARECQCMSQDIKVQKPISDMQSDIYQKTERILRYEDVERHYVVYMHIVPNGKRYVGITKNNPISRWNSGMGYIDHQEFYDDICIYGWSNIGHHILFTDLSKKEALLKENELILKYDLLNPNCGYNKKLNDVQHDTKSIDDDIYKGTCVTTLRISGTLKTKLRQIAHSEHKTLNSLITHLLVQAINDYTLRQNVS